MKVKKISERGYRFEFWPQNEWVMYSYGINSKNYFFVIDTGCGSEDGLQIKEFIRNTCQIKKEIIVINTHHHFDHVWGNVVFKDNLIIGSEKTAQIMNEKYEETLTKQGYYLNGNVENILPNAIVNGSLYFKEEGIFIFESIGHTVDGIAILDQKDGILYIGDNIGDFYDTPVPELEVESDIYIKEIMKLKEMKFDILASGHNELQSKAFLDLILKNLH